MFFTAVFILVILSQGRENVKAKYARRIWPRNAPYKSQGVEKVAV